MFVCDIYVFIYVYRHIPIIHCCVLCTCLYILLYIHTYLTFNILTILLFYTYIIYTISIQKLPSELLPLIWVSLKAFGSTDTLTRLIDVPKPYMSLKRVGTGWGTRMNSKMIRRTQVEVALHTNTSILPPPPPTQHQPQQRHPQQGKAVSRQVQYKSSHETYDASTETAETAEIVDSYNHMHIEDNNSSKQTSSSSSAAVTSSSSYRGPDSHNFSNSGGRKKWSDKGVQGKQNKPLYPPRPPSATAASSSSSQPLNHTNTATASTSSTSVTSNKPSNNLSSNTNNIRSGSNNAKSSSTSNERTSAQANQKKQRQNTNTTDTTATSSSPAAT